MGFGVEWGELEADYPFGWDGVAVDLGGGEVPAMRGLQSLVGEIAAGAGGEELGGGDVAGGIDVELDGYVDGAADGGARARRNIGHDLREHFALGDGFSGRLDARGICDVGERSGSGGAQRALVAGFFQRRVRRNWRGVLRRI